jgi:hypothetical protein
MGASGSDDLGPVMQVALVVDTACWWSDPVSVTLADGDVCRQTTNYGIVYSSACHTQSASWAVKVLRGRGGVADKSTQSCPDDGFGLAARGG